MKYNKYQKNYPTNGHSKIFNQLYGSFVNFGLKWGVSLLAGEKAAQHSGRLRYRLTKAIAQKTANWK
jgi:hypothetical protein